ncbi:MAG: hypothetical protein HYS05_09440 [Acidobacteria bacterium]|nr:hypothetical protein [Acidobacteriota bacterium]
MAGRGKNSKGELAGTFGNPAQRLRGLPLSKVAVEGKSVRFQIGRVAGERTFEGALSADGKSISGTYSQSGGSVPFSLTRTGDPRIEAAAKSAPIGRELEGTWNGTLAVDGKQLRFVLTMSNEPDGTATGSIVNLDEGELEIPVSTITQAGSNLTLDFKTVGGSYAGALNKEGTELVGTYSQGAFVAPLTFRLAKP